MQNEHLEHLLQQADAARPAPGLGRSMVAAAEGRVRRRRRIRAAGAVMAMVLLVGVGIFVNNRPQTKSIDIAERNPTIDAAALSAQIQEHTQVAELLIADHRLQVAGARLAELSHGPGSEIWLQNQRERAATTLLHGAVLSTNKTESAVVCREVVKLFPEASAATVAQARLLEIR